MGSKTSREADMLAPRKSPSGPPHFDIVITGSKGSGKSSLSQGWLNSIAVTGEKDETSESFTGTLDTLDGLKVSITCRIRASDSNEGASIYSGNHINVVVYNASELGAGDHLLETLSTVRSHCKNPSIAVVIGTSGDELAHGDETLRAEAAARKFDAITFLVSCKTGHNVADSLVEIVTKAERTLC